MSAMLSLGSPPCHDNANIAVCKRRNEKRNLFFLVVAAAGSADCLALLAAKIGKDARMRMDRRKEAKTLSAALFGRGHLLSTSEASRLRACLLPGLALGSETSLRHRLVLPLLLCSRLVPLGLGACLRLGNCFWGLALQEVLEEVCSSLSCLGLLDKLLVESLGVLLLRQDRWGGAAGPGPAGYGRVGGGT